MTNFILEEKLAGLRKKWLDYRKKGDLIMCSVVERQAKAYKIAAGKVKEIFK